jgi:glycosyltransferase involved in cell wall biosynthesis
MVEAMATVRQVLPEANLWLVGNASSQYLAYLHQKIDSLNLSQNVTIKPAIPYYQVPALIARATLGLAALQLNESYRRSIQVKPFEFMAMGVPVLGAKVPSISKFVVATGAGLVVDPLTPDQLASQIIELLQNPAIRVKMGLSGRQAVLQKYNWEQTKPTLLKVYQSLLPC